jgi:hypothetical protein
MRASSDPTIDRATASRGHLGGTWRSVFTFRQSELARWVEHEPLTGHSELACELSTAVQRKRELETTRPQAYIHGDMKQAYATRSLRDRNRRRR